MRSLNEAQLTFLRKLDKFRFEEFSNSPEEWDLIDSLVYFIETLDSTSLQRAIEDYRE